MEWQGHRFVRFLAFYTDPYLNIFRRLIPPDRRHAGSQPDPGFFGIEIS